MRTATLWLAIVVPLLISGCDLIGGIFKAGMWVGVLAVVVVIAIIVWIASRFRR